ncbi:uncharacterized protein I303_106716 [Kwoniella dejecticola CBS 10117]|uniref:Uncharacterized protein n=1 Tax=Kwoniella dejecticola CBS 10117 TaxID=1296121 RepID=A0AAJ8KTM4_9TREE
MFALFIPLFTLASWSWIPWHSPFSSSSPTTPNLDVSNSTLLHQIADIKWDFVSSSAISFFEHLSDQYIGDFAALNLTLAPDNVKQHFKQEMGQVEEVIAYINWTDVPKDTIQWIKDHPSETAFIALDIGLFIAPWLVTEPVLFLLGFRRLGPVAGSAASIAQRAIGKLEARGFFALLQSAGMKAMGRVSWKV